MRSEGLGVWQEDTHALAVLVGRVVWADGSLTRPDRHSARVWGRPERRAALVWIKAVVELVEVRMAAGKRSSPGGTGSAHVSHSLVVSTR